MEVMGEGDGRPARGGRDHREGVGGAFGRFEHQLCIPPHGFWVRRSYDVGCVTSSVPGASHGNVECGRSLDLGADRSFARRIVWRSSLVNIAAV